MTVVASMIVRNEAHRYLRQALECARQVVGDGIIAITDDASTDETRDVCRSYGAMLQTTPEPLFWTHEGRARQRHYEFVESYVTHGDWILCLDADETVSSPERVPEVIERAERMGRRVVGLPLYEFWTHGYYRTDGFWHGTQATRLFAWEPGGRIADREFGCGSEPDYVAKHRFWRQSYVHLLHWGYLDSQDRARKQKAYLERLGGHGHSEKHVRSITSEPTLREYV